MRLSGQNTCDLQNMRVALVNPCSAGHHTGYLLYLALGMRSLGVETLLMAPNAVYTPAGERELTLASRSYELPLCRGLRRQWVGLDLYRKAIREAVAWGATHIHFLYADWNLTGIATAWLIERPAAALALTVHWATGVGTGGGTVKSRLCRTPHRIALRMLSRLHSTVILVHHQAIAHMLCQDLGVGRIAVVPYPVEPLPPVALATVALFRQQLGLDNNDCLVLCYGGTRSDKGADLAISTLARLPERYHLLIAGTPQRFSAETLETLAAGLGILRRTHLIAHWLSDEETAKFFHASDIVLLPYRQTFSGQSGPMMQGMAIGKPVVVPELPVLVDTVTSYGMGIIYPVEHIEAMAAAIQTAEGRHIDVSQKDVFVDQHAPLAFAQAVRDAYKTVEGGNL